MKANLMNFRLRCLLAFGFALSCHGFSTKLSNHENSIVCFKSWKYPVLYSSLKENVDEVQSEKDVILENSRNISLSLENQLDTLGRNEEERLELSQKVSNLLRDKVLLGIEPKPDIIAIITIYFVEGAISLARLAQTFFLKDTLQLGPAEMSALTGLFTIPWTIKPVYGFLSDGFPIFGYRRRSYLILAGIIGCLSYLFLGFDFGSGASGSIDTLTGTIVALVTSSACIAFSDVVADGVVVQKTRDSNDPKLAGGLQSLCWGSAAIGGLISAYFSGSLLEIMTPRDVFRISSFLPLMVAAIALFIQEDPVQKENTLAGVEDQIENLWSAIKLPSVWKPTLFLFLWQATPTSGGAFLYFMTNELGMGPEFLGRVRLLTSLAGLVGVWGYQKYLREVPIKSILFWTSIASAPLGLSQLLLISHYNRVLGIPDSAFLLGDDVALTILGQLAFLPTLVLAAKICPPGVEAVLFATLMSVFNLSGTVGTEFGAILTKYLGVTESNFDNLGLLTIICNLTSLGSLIFLGLLDDFGEMSAAEMEAEVDDNTQEVNTAN